MKITVTNFGALGPGAFTAEFENGINSVVGPNGTGKSTLVEALYFAITGEPLKSVNITDLITWGCADMSVHLVINDIEILRTVQEGKPTKVVFKRGETKIDRKVESDEAILAAFGLSDKSAFRNVFFAEQFNAVQILDGPDSSRLEMLVNLFGLTRLERIRTKLQDAASSLNCAGIGEELHKTLVDNVEATTKQKQEIEDTLVSVGSNILSDDDFENINKISCQRSEEEQTKLKQDIDNNKELLAGCEADLAELPAPPSPEQQKLCLGAKQYRLVEEQFKRAEKRMQEEGGPVVPSSTSVDQMRHSANKEAAGIQHDIEELRNRLTIIKAGCCPITGGAPCADLLACTNPATVNADITEKEKTLEQIENDVKELTVLFNEALSKEATVTAIQNEYNKEREALQKLEVYKDFDVEAFEERTKAFNEATEKRSELAEKIGGLKREIAIQQSEYELNDLTTSYTQQQIDDAKRFKEEHEKAVIEASTLETQLKKAAELVANANTALIEAEEQNKKAERNQYIKDVFIKARTILHKDNLPRQLIDELKQELNSKQSYYLNMFNFPYEVKWMSGGSLVYINDVGDVTPVTNLSGGQKYVVLTAMRCALVEFLSSSFPFMVLDEPTTGLDIENRESLATVLETVANTMLERGMSLIVPTHDSMLLSNANTINVGD